MVGQKASASIVGDAPRAPLSLDGLKLTTVCTQFSICNSCLHLIRKHHQKYIQHSGNLGSAIPVYTLDGGYTFNINSRYAAHTSKLAINTQSTNSKSG
jgi:hypothetical protein